MINKREAFYIGVGLLLALTIAAKADAEDAVTVTTSGCTTATQYGKVMMQCPDGTVSVMNNNTLYVCRALPTGNTECTQHDIGKE